MPELLRMPEVAAGNQSARLAEWLTAEDQAYTTADSLAAIETDKAVVDLTPDSDGVLLRHLVTPGTDVPVGDPIALIAAPDETVEDVDSAVVTLTAQAGLAEQPTPSPTPSTTADATASSPRAPRIFTSPLARRLAAEAGIPVESIIGTGPHGRIVRADVERSIAEGNQPDGKASAAPVPSTVPVPPGSPSEPAPPLLAPQVQTPTASVPSKQADSPETDEAEPATYKLVPHSQMRRTIAQRLTASVQSIPHFTVSGSAEVDDLLTLRAQLNEGDHGSISLNDLVLKAVAHAHCLVPEANVVWADEGMRCYDHVDVGVAVAIDGGLVTPVVRAVDQRSVGAVAQATRDFAQRARIGRLRQHELLGGSITVSNLGMYGIEQFSAIINPPQAAILAVGAAQPQPVATASGGVECRSVMRLTLSVDHRAIDGALAARWMAALVDLLQHPLRVLR